MKLIQYGDHEEYRQAQINANKLKFRNVFAENEELRRIALDFANNGGRGLCHGVRNGYEVRFLRDHLPDLNLVGTDISPTVTDVPNCILWDMHEAKDEWRGNIDFIYSNSWDHTYDPDKLFGTWASCLSPNGRMYIAYTAKHSEEGVTEASKYDAFGCSLGELVTICQRYAALVDVLEIAPRVSAKGIRRHLSYLRNGRWSAFFNRSLRSRRIVVFVFKKKI